MKLKISLLVGLFALSSCGQGVGGETIFFYFINAYSGADSVSVIGPTGPLFQNAKFGDRIGLNKSGAVTSCLHEEDPAFSSKATPCVPIEFNRNLGGDFTTIVSGAPSSYDFSRPVFALYPQETATMVFSGRIGNGDAVETSLLRHTQSITNACVLSFVNALSLDNTETLGGDQYNLVPEFKIDSPESAGYIDEVNFPIPSECGNIPVGHDAQKQLARNIYPSIKANPWFLPTPCKDETGGENALCFVWGVPDQQNRSLIFSGPSSPTLSSSADYFECIQGAIKFDAPAGGGGGGGAGMDEDKCPPDISTAKISVDTEALENCQKSQSVSVESVPPTDQGGQRVSFRFHDVTQACQPTFRMRTPNLDVVFGPKSGDKLGRHGAGELIVIKPKINKGNEYFVVFMGRPVNPIIWRWGSGTNIANLDSFPYGNGQNGQIGKP